MLGEDTEVSKTAQAIGLGYSTRTKWKDPIAKDKTHFEYRTYIKKKNQVATDLEISSLLVHFIVLEDDTQGEDIPREKTSMVLTSAGPEGYETDLPGKTRLLGAIVA